MSKFNSKSEIIFNNFEKQDKIRSLFKKSVSFHTLGCRLNQSETDVLVRIFQQKGCEIVPNIERADICVINTCTVTENSDAKNRQVIRSMSRLDPKPIIVVVGCYAQINPEAIARIDGVDLIIGNENKMQLINYLEKVDYENLPIIVRKKIHKKTFITPVIPKFKNSKFTKQQNDKKFEENFQTNYSNSENILNKKNNFPLLNKSVSKSNLKSFKNNQKNTIIIGRTRSSLKIQDGCDFMCSFCIIPFARGRSRYRELSNIKDEANMLVKEGVREIVVTGVNVGTYQADNSNLVNVIDFLNGLEGLNRIRISSIEPTTVPKILFQYMKDSQHKLVPFLHLPLQSGSDNILKKMKRHYTTSEFSDEIWQAFETIPDLCIGTDIMVGFPGENKTEFKKTLTLLQNLPLTYFHVFPFSKREGTPASKLKEQIIPQIKQKRSEILRDLSSKKRQSFNKRFLGQIRNVLFENRSKGGNFKGYTDNFIKIVLNLNDDPDLQNKIIPVKLCELRGNTILGRYQNN